MKIGVIGAGPAGMMAAGRAAENGADVTLFEKNASVGRKLAITGKGRCNVTNNCSFQTFQENVPTNPRFLYSAVSAFSPSDTMAFFEEHGVSLKTERGQRVFPVSDRAFDIVDCMRDFVRKNGARIINEKVTELSPLENGFEIETEKRKYVFDRVILCTGGASYPLTGSTGDGYAFAKNLGLEIIPAKPSLVPLETEGDTAKKLMGLSLRNIAIKIDNIQTGKTVYTDFGEMLFTHFGVSGPVILSASAHIRNIEKGVFRLHIDLKPALDEQTLDKRLISEFELAHNKNYSTVLAALLPQKMIPVFAVKSGIESEKKVNSITKDERKKIIRLLKDFSLDIKGFRPIEEAIITSGGISVKEINPKNMECKKIKGLYFAGEIIDVDAYTGGFNLQIAFSTGNLAGISAATE